VAYTPHHNHEKELFGAVKPPQIPPKRELCIIPAAASGSINQWWYDGIMYTGANKSVYESEASDA
jgi:hypothetical protein